jgi:acetyl-CoA/propionyl-CoA carboxylase carboxyl transferase subunit
VARIFAAIVAASGVVPQISVVLGSAAGGAAYGAALTDMVVMTEDAKVFVTGPAVVGQVTGQRLSAEELGGPGVHSQSSGVAHLIARDRKEAVTRTADLVELLSDGAAPPGVPDHPDPGLRLPESPRRAYDVRGLVTDLLDDGMINLQERWAPNVVTALGRLAGHPVGVIANNPIRRGGCLDAASGDKAARFVRFCDSFGIPLVVLVDVPGYLPGLDQERTGVVRRGAKLLHAFAGARVTRITVIIRKAFGGAYVAMNSKGLGATAVLAWPSADIGIMNAGSAVDILHRKELAACASDEERATLREERLRDYAQRAGGLNRALQDGSVDAVIEPAHTREALASLLASHAPCPSSRPNLPL